MSKSRRLIAFCLLGFLSSATLLAVPVNIKVRRTQVLFGGSVPMFLYVNGEKVGTIPDGQEVAFRFDARPGLNEAFIKAKTAVYKARPYWSEDGVSQVPKRHLFLVSRPDEEIIFDVGYFNFYSDKGIFKISTAIDQQHAAKIEGVELNKTLRSVVIKESPVYRLAPNTDHVVEDSLTLRHEIKTSTTWKVGADLKAKVNVAWGAITLGILGELEKVTSSDFLVETKRTRSVIIRAGSPVKVVWVEYFRTGTAIVRIDGRKVRIPFEVDEDFDLLTELAK